MRAVANALSAFTGPVLVIPDDPNRPLTAIDGRIALPAPAVEARGTAIPKPPPRDIGGRRPDRREPAVPATLTLDVVDSACDAIRLLR